MVGDCNARLDYLCLSRHRIICYVEEGMSVGNHLTCCLSTLLIYVDYQYVEQSDGCGTCASRVLDGFVRMGECRNLREDILYIFLLKSERRQLLRWIVRVFLISAEY